MHKTLSSQQKDRRIRQRCSITSLLGHPTNVIAGQGPTVLALGIGKGYLDIFFLSCLSFLFSFSLSLGDWLNTD